MFRDGTQNKGKRQDHYGTGRRMLAGGLCLALAATLGGCSPLEKAVIEGLSRAQQAAVESETEQNWDLEVESGYETWDQVLAGAEAMPDTGAMESWESPAWNTSGWDQWDDPEWTTPDWNTEEYRYLEENAWQRTEAAPFATFAADVDTASYANVRRMLRSGQQVPAAAVRIEEMINYFSYDYPQAEEGESFSVSTQLAPCPWNEETWLLQIGLRAREVPVEERPTSNLVFLIDVSGSMADADKLPLVQRAFRLLAETLGEQDVVSIVTYANEDTVVLEGVSGADTAVLCEAMEDLSPWGGTNGSDGLIRAYEIARCYYMDGGNNRVILATDGDLNIGMSDEGSLTRLIEEQAATGVALSVLGFGQGNLSDVNMEALADHGNGNYSYIDSIAEARRVLVDEAGGTLFTVASDVKLQVEFNPARVKGYRLIGYENRQMAATSFADDTKDGGEIGSGHTVTALFEVAAADGTFDLPGVESRYGVSTSGEDLLAREWGILHVRGKDSGQTQSTLKDYVIDDNAVREEMDDNLSWAAGVAQIGMLLKDSPYAGTTQAGQVLGRLRELTGGDPLREEFVSLIEDVKRGL